MGKKGKENHHIKIISFISLILNSLLGIILTLSNLYTTSPKLVIFGLSLVYLTIVLSFVILKSNLMTKNEIKEQNNDIKKEALVSMSDRELLDSFKQKSIIGIKDNKPCDYSKVSKKILEAEHTIKIIAYYGEGILNNIREELSKAINKNIEIQLLIAKKGSILVNEVMELEEVSIDRYEFVQGIISEIKKKTKDKPNGFKLKEYNTQARYALVAIDGAWAWWTPYHPGITTEQSVSFELTDEGKDSFIHLCTSHFQKLWDIIP